MNLTQMMGWCAHAEAIKTAPHARILRTCPDMVQLIFVTGPLRKMRGQVLNCCELPPEEDLAVVPFALTMRKVQYPHTEDHARACIENRLLGKLRQRIDRVHG